MTLENFSEFCKKKSCNQEIFKVKESPQTGFPFRGRSGERIVDATRVNMNLVEYMTVVALDTWNEFVLWLVGE